MIICLKLLQMSSPASDDKNWIQSDAEERPHFHFPLDNELVI